MKKWIAIAFTVIVTSFYFFPFEFRFLPGVNTKMAMAGIGVLMLMINLARQRKSTVDKDFLQLALIACVVSLVGFISVTVNGTHDYTYSTYIISMLVWSSGAYVLTRVIRFTHSSIKFETVCNYIICICVIQCILAILIDNIPAFKSLVNTYIGGIGFEDMEGLERLHRLYGIGASLDVAGTRFSAALIMISFICSNKNTNNIKLISYSIAFIIITIIGNMISRTTTIGAIIAITYIVLSSSLLRQRILAYSKKFIKWFILIIAATIPVIIYLYNFNSDFNEQIRFAFEGFFSMAEKGTWEVHSNEILKDMYVFPDNMKTWIIGDGYFDNPYYAEQYYTGEKWGGFYKATDVGYLRFIYYFGCIGLFAFIAFFIQTAKVCANRFPKWKTLFWVLLMLNFIIWFKVSTDIFLVFALFLSFSEEDDDSETECTNNDEIATAQ